MPDLKHSKMESSSQENSSSRSTTPNSSSTYKYSHEPYETFQRKIKKLASELYHTPLVSVWKIRGGSYNRIVGATVQTAEQEIQGVFRIPRFSPPVHHEQCVPEKSNTPPFDAQILDNATILKYVGIQPQLQAPKLLAFDITMQNSLGSPYIFQEYATGRPLEEVYEQMNINQKKCMIDAMVGLLLSMEDFTFPVVGRLCNSQSASATTKMSNASGLVSDSPPTIGPFEIGFGDSKFESGPYSSLHDMLHTQIRAWCEYHMSEDQSIWNSFNQILQEMKVLGFFDHNEINQMTNVLFHWDLEPRNIIVRQLANSSGEEDWQIVKVIDWDECLSVPTILTRRPPAWIWDFSDDTDTEEAFATGYDGDVDLLPLEAYDADSGRLNTEGLDLKAYFESQLQRGLRERGQFMTAELYHDQAYGKGRWTRRLARFAFYGMGDNQDWKRFEQLMEEWSTATSTMEYAQ